MDLTPFSVAPGHILVGYVVGGAILSAFGFYQPLVDLAGAGATIPLSGFGHSLAQGAITGVKENGLLGALGGGLEAASIGVTGAVVLGYVMAVVFNPQG